MPLHSIQSSNPNDSRSRLLHLFRSLSQGLVRGTKSLQKLFRMTGKTTKAPLDGSSETIVALKQVNSRVVAPNLAVKQMKVSSNVNKAPKASSLENREIGFSGRLVSSSKGSSVAPPKRVAAAPKIGGTGKVSTPRISGDSQEKVVAAHDKVSAVRKVSSALKGCVESKVKPSGTVEKKKKEASVSKAPLRNTPASKPPLQNTPASKPPLRTSPTLKGKEKMETSSPPPPKTSATTKVEKLKLGGGTHQRACTDSKLKSATEVKGQKQVGRQKVLEPSNKRLVRSSKPCLPPKKMKKPIQPAVEQGNTFYLVWDDELGFGEEQDSKVGQECLICERDLSFAPVPPETEMGTCNFPEVAVLPCGHVFHMICLDTVSANQPFEPTCFMCTSLC